MTLHVASHNLNIGDGALISVIQKRLPKPIEHGDIALEDKERLRRRILRSDRVIIGGGGSIANSRNGYATQCPVGPEDIKEGMAFVACGYNQFYNQDYLHWPELKLLIQACKNEGVPFTVREDGSKEKIEEGTGLEIEEIPDPGMFVEVDEQYESPYIRKGKKNVIIQLAGDGDRGMEKDSKVLESLVLSAIGMIFKYDANVILMPHIVYDLWLVHNFCMKIREFHGDKIRGNIAVGGIVHPREYARFFKTYKDADLVIGMRGHAVICGVGLGVPTIAIDSHPKVKGFMEKMGLAEYMYDWPSGYYQCTDLLDHPETYTVDLSGPKHRFDAFMDRIQ